MMMMRMRREGWRMGSEEDGMGRVEDGMGWDGMGWEGRPEGSTEKSQKDDTTRRRNDTLPAKNSADQTNKGCLAKRNKKPDRATKTKRRWKQQASFFSFLGPSPPHIPAPR